MGLEAVYGPATDRQEAIRIIRAAVDNVAWKIYALGRGIEYYDAAAIRAIVRESAEGFRKEMVVVSGTTHHEADVLQSGNNGDHTRGTTSRGYSISLPGVM